jgi:hypothetical protein
MQIGLRAASGVRAAACRPVVARLPVRVSQVRLEPGRVGQRDAVRGVSPLLRSRHKATRPCGCTRAVASRSFWPGTRQEARGGVRGSPARRGAGRESHSKPPRLNNEARGSHSARSGCQKARSRIRSSRAGASAPTGAFARGARPAAALAARARPVETLRRAFPSQRRSVAVRAATEEPSVDVDKIVKDLSEKARARKRQLRRRVCKRGGPLGRGRRTS